MNHQNFIISIHTTHGPGQAQLILPNSWDYLVKVKSKNQEKLLKSQRWIKLIGNNDITICTFSYMASVILWQLSVFVYNIPVMMRQKKNMFTKQEHCSFIECSIVIPAKNNNQKRTSNKT